MHFRVRVIFIVLVIILFSMSSGCLQKSQNISVSIDGVDFQPGCKVSSIIDAGFQIGESDHFRSVYYMDLPTVKAKTTSEFFVFKDFVPSHVGIFVYNSSDHNVELEECIVYMFLYDRSEYMSNEIECLNVRLNGVDLYFSDSKQVINSLEYQGFKFNELEKTEFLTEDNSDIELHLTGNCGDVYQITVSNIYDRESDTRLINSFAVSINIE